MKLARQLSSLWLAAGLTANAGQDPVRHQGKFDGGGNGPPSPSPGIAHENRPKPKDDPTTQRFLAVVGRPRAEPTPVGIVDGQFYPPALGSNVCLNRVEAIGRPGIDDDENGFGDDAAGANIQRKSGDVFITTFDNPNLLPGIPAGILRHGTHVAQTLAEAAGTSATLILASVGDSQYFDDPLVDEHTKANALAAGIRYVAARGARVVNVSLAPTSPETQVSVAQAMAQHTNVLFVIAAGNSGRDIGNTDHDDPLRIDAWRRTVARLNNVVFVAATDGNGHLLTWKPGDGNDKLEPSNFGLGCVALAATGVFRDIPVLPKEPPQTSRRYRHPLRAATSIAAPHVAAAASAVLRINPRLGPPQVARVLMESSSANPSCVGKVDAGGPIDLPRAQLLAAMTAVFSDSPPESLSQARTLLAERKIHAGGNGKASVKKDRFEELTRAAVEIASGCRWRVTND